MASKAQMLATLQRIIDFSDHDYPTDGEALKAVVEMASECLTEKKVNSFDEKVKELTKFIMAGNFNLLFESHEDIAASLNSAGILSPSGKQWTRTNVSKILKPVREAVTERMNSVAENPEAEQPDPAEPTTRTEAKRRNVADEGIEMGEVEPGEIGGAGGEDADDEVGDLEALDDLEAI
jgi:hypothetical protein